MTEPWIVIDGHAPWCAYIKTLHRLAGMEEQCDCYGWDDEEDDYSYYADGDTGWWG